MIGSVSNILSERWSGKKCKLNGKPARISGMYCGFATVETAADKKFATFSWYYVEKIMNHDQNFTTGGSND